MSFWRKEEPVLNKAGEVITGGMWDHQREWWDSEAFIKALVTGYGSGKTLVGGKRSIALALQNAPAPHLIVTPSHRMGSRTIIPTIKLLLDGKKKLLPGFTYRFNKSDSEFTIWWKGRVATIWMASGDNPESLKGPNIGSALIDEPFIQEREVFDQVLARVRDPQARYQEIGITGTPEDLNWGYSICEGEEHENFDIQVIHASSKANKAIGPAFVQRLERGFSEKAAQAYIDGQFVSLSEGLVYYAFDEATNVIDLPDPGLEIGIGMDFNVDPMAGVAFWTSGNHMHIVDELELPNSDTEFMCQTIHEEYDLPDGRGCRVRAVYPDASGRARKSVAPGGRSDFHYIREAGFEVRCGSINPPRRDRYNAVNGKFKPRQGAPSLTISPRCKKLILYLKGYSYRKMNDQKNMSHLLDALGYPVAHLYPVRGQPQQMRLVGH